MELAKKSLLERFSQEFIAFSILFAFMVIVLCLIVTVYVKKYRIIRTQTKIIISIVVIILIFLVVVLALLEIRYIKDLKYIKNAEIMQIEGEVVGFAKSVSNGDDLTVTQSWPIIKDSKTDQTVTLNVLNSDQKLEKGKQYTIIYLPNTKLAEIVQ